MREGGKIRHKPDKKAKYDSTFSPFSNFLDRNAREFSAHTIQPPSIDTEWRYSILFWYHKSMSEIVPNVLNHQLSRKFDLQLNLFINEATPVYTKLDEDAYRQLNQTLLHLPSRRTTHHDKTEDLE